jgi:organic radical activating enzyme
MSKFRYTEKFYSIQGEGRYMGVPSVFLRMFGCNFRCKNFGRIGDAALGDTVTHNPEVVEVIKNIGQYKSIKELPLVTTGCDSYSAVYPEFKDFAIKETADELANGIMEILPFNQWRDEHLILTGGEPLLGGQRVYPELLDHEKMQSLKELTFETNGTHELSPEFKQYLLEWTNKHNPALNRARGYNALTFSVSAKLPCSGEPWEKAIKPNVVCDYQEVGHTVLKFVIATEADYADAERAIAEYRAAGFTGDVYLMPVGGVESVYALNNRRVAELALKAGLRYSDRLQLPLFANAWGT